MCTISSKAEAGCRGPWSFYPSHWGVCALTSLLFSWQPSGWTVNQISETSWTKQIIWKWLSKSDSSFGLWHNWKKLHQSSWNQWITAEGLDTSNRERETVFVQLLSLMEMCHGMAAPPQEEGCGRKQPSSVNWVCYTHTQDRSSCFPAIQCYFLPVHSFNHHRCLKKLEQVGFSQCLCWLLLWICSRINWDAGLIFWEKETLFHLSKSSTEAFIHLLFIQCSFLASFLFPAT